MQTNLRVRAISADHEVDLRKVTRLFRNVYGESFPIQSVYHLEFWRRHVGKRFTSLVVERDGLLLAHLSYAPENENPKNVQIGFPACAPESIDEMEDIGRALMSVLESQAERQSWEMIYFFVINNLPGFQVLASKIIQASEVAILPGYFAASDFRPRGIRLRLPERKNNELRRPNITVTQKIMRPLKLEGSEGRVLYVPKEEEELIRAIYQPLSLARSIETTASLKKASREPNERIFAPFEGSFKQYFSRIQTSLLYLQPEKSLRRIGETIKDFEKAPALSRFLFLNAEDPFCPELAEKIRGFGYDFCGVFPLLTGRDHLVYFRSEDYEILDEAEEAYSEAGRLLLARLRSQSNTSSKALQSQPA